MSKGWMTVEREYMTAAVASPFRLFEKNRKAKAPHPNNVKPAQRTLASPRRKRQPRVPVRRAINVRAGEMTAQKGDGFARAARQMLAKNTTTMSLAIVIRRTIARHLPGKQSRSLV